MMLVKAAVNSMEASGFPWGSDEGANYTLECGHLGGELSISSSTWPAQLYTPTEMTFSETLNAADGFIL